MAAILLKSTRSMDTTSSARELRNSCRVFLPSFACDRIKFSFSGAGSAPSPSGWGHEGIGRRGAIGCQVGSVGGVAKHASPVALSSDSTVALLRSFLHE